MASTLPDIKQLIKNRATELGFDACGFACASEVDAGARHRYERWLSTGANGCMEWAANHQELRDDPTLLLEGAQTVIVVAMNYLPAKFQRHDVPQFAYYAYGRDYHEVIRQRLYQLGAFIHEHWGAACRVCVDSAPIRERYWAQQAGVGFIGRNNALIIPGRGSWFFLGVLLTTAVIEPDAPCTLTCGDCGACERACPTGALRGGEPVDARRCLSCLTIEQKGDLPEWVGDVIGNHVYGCDECQKCCPHNRNAKPTTIAEFQPTDDFLSLDAESIMSMDQATFSRLFSHSAVKRAKLSNLHRNCAMIKD